ncbi:MAG: tRNA pseudouridine(38-40) synthase TruA [Pseudomonadota bacterium]
MPRFRITVEYDGTPFVGWQMQASDPSIQQALVDAIAAFTGEFVSVRGAGRTDAGVHARGQVCHFDLTKDWSADKVREALNAHLRPAPIAVTHASTAPTEFDARFSATARHYRYVILNRRSPPALEANRVWWVPVPLDAVAMETAASVLVGHHDFTTFRAARCQAASPIKTLDQISVTRDHDHVVVTASARSFLHNQVRSMVGSLKLVGAGKWSRDDLAAALAAKDRRACGTVAPAAGLFLEKVDYPDD